MIKREIKIKVRVNLELEATQSNEFKIRHSYEITALNSLCKDIKIYVEVLYYCVRDLRHQSSVIRIRNAVRFTIIRQNV